MKKFLTLTIIAIIALIGLSVSVNAATTLQEQIDAATSGATITLDKNYTEDIVIKDNKEITINLNEKKLTSVSSNTITVELGSKLTVEGEGEIITNVSNRAAIFNNGTTIINGGTIKKEAVKNYYNITNHGDMEINGGTIINDFAYVSGETHGSLVENGYYSYSSGDQFTGYVSGVNHDDGGILTINAGTFKNNIQVALFNVNDATIKGGTFEVPTGNDKTTVYNRKYDDSTDIGKLTVTGGTFKAEYFIQTNGTMWGEVSIKGGTFDITKGLVNPKNEDGTDRPQMNPEVTGGTFSSDVNQYISGDTTWTYDEKGNMVIFVPIYLDKPTNVKWDGTKATWDAVPNADGYGIMLTNGEWSIQQPIWVDGTSYDFSKYLTNKNAEYIFIVWAEGNGNPYYYSDDAESEAYVFPAEEPKVEEDKTTSGQGTTEQQPAKDEKDDTPKTGSVDVVVFASAIVAVISLGGIVLVKKYAR